MLLSNALMLHRMLLQYRPHSLDKFVLHDDIAVNLKKLVRNFGWIGECFSVRGLPSATLRRQWQSASTLLACLRRHHNLILLVPVW